MKKAKTSTNKEDRYKELLGDSYNKKVTQRVPSISDDGAYNPSEIIDVLLDASNQGGDDYSGGACGRQECICPCSEIFQDLFI